MAKSHVPFGIFLAGAACVAAGFILMSDEAVEEFEELTPEEFLVIQNELEEIVERQSPREALAVLRVRIKEDPLMLRSCHPFTHVIGRAAYEKERGFAEAVAYRDEICNSGYLHGIIESHFVESPDMITAMDGVCDPYKADDFLSWQCHHGVGHGLMFATENDLPASLEFCDRFEGANRGSCVNGVFMENFSSDQKIHLSAYLKEDDPLYPCAEQEERNKGDCYIYAPTYYLALHPAAYRDALTWCETAESSFRGSCMHGVGSQTMKENLHDPRIAESVCKDAEAAHRDSCIHGMIDLALNHYADSASVAEICPLLSVRNRAICEKMVASRSFGS